MTREEVTLVAAVVAAISGLISVAMSVWGQKNAEFRAAHRALMADYLEELGKAIHESVATTHVLVHKSNSGGNVDAWRKRAEKAKEELGGLRRRVRYSLWGIDDGLRDLTRLSSWVSHNKDYPENTKQMLSAAEGLRKSLDDAIRLSYRQGKPPSRRQSRRVAAAAGRLRTVYEAAMEHNLGEEAPDEL